MRYRAIGPALLLLCCLAGTPALAAVDMGLPVATLKVVVTNGGVDAGDKGGFEVRPAGQHTADSHRL